MSDARQVWHELVLDARVRWLRSRPTGADPRFQISAAAELALRRSKISSGEIYGALAEIELSCACSHVWDAALRNGRLFPNPRASNFWIGEDFLFFRFVQSGNIPFIQGFMDQAPGELIRQALGRREIQRED